MDYSTNNFYNIYLESESGDKFLASTNYVTSLIYVLEKLTKKGKSVNYAPACGKPQLPCIDNPKSLLIKCEALIADFEEEQNNNTTL